MEADLRRLANELGIARNVTLTGYVDDVLPYYQHVFDINVLVSRTEGLGISVIEGAACGLPAVVSNCTGLPETVVEGETGLLFDLDDAEGLRGHLLRLAESPSLRASMGGPAEPSPKNALPRLHTTKTSWSSSMTCCERTCSDTLVRRTVPEAAGGLGW